MATDIKVRWRPEFSGPEQNDGWEYVGKKLTPQQFSVRDTYLEITDRRYVGGTAHARRIIPFASIVEMRIEG